MTPVASASGDELAAALVRAREALRISLAAGPAGADVSGVAEFSASVAGILRDHHDAVTASAGALHPGTLLATGALARGELLPFSDVDLVVLREGASGEDPAFAEWMRELVHPLWAAGLKVQATVQDHEGWLAAAVADLPLCTSLLDLRRLAGDADAVERLRTAARARFFGEQREPFLRRLSDEVEERHRRYGATVYRVEPDLKFGPGGARDLAVVGWALSAAYGTADLDELAARGELRPRAAERLAAARAVLLRLRAALHLGMGRTQDRLVFPAQERIPALLGAFVPEGDDRALVAAIEAFMQDYYRAAGDVLRDGRRVFALCRPASDAAAVAERIDERFELVEGRLRHTGADPFADAPVLALEALAVARARQAALAGETVDCILDAAVAAQARDFEDPEAQRLFLELLAGAGDAAVPSAVAQLHALRLVDRLVPEFAASRGRMQHDSYHVYTVDQHSVFAVEFLDAIGRGEHRRDLPLATALQLGLGDRRPLYLATLLHDAGKAYGDQCVEGERIASAAARRAGLDEATALRCALLVREHLTMPRISQKRDLGDPRLIEDFAASIGDPHTLAELYLLCIADMSTVSPDFLTTWKRTLLDELYLRALAALLHRDRAPAPRRDRPGEPEGLPERYYSLFDAELRRQHRRMIDARRARRLGRGLLGLDVAEGAGAVRLTVVAVDRPGLLANLTAVFFDFGLSVVAADLFTAPGDPAVALDVFRVAPGEGREGVLADGWAARLAAELEARIDTPPERLLADLRPLPDPERGRRLRVEDRVRFSVDLGGERSIVEVETADQPGVLRRIAAAFLASGVDIEVARLTSEARRVHDVFYVARLSDDDRERLRGAVLEYLHRR